MLTALVAILISSVAAAVLAWFRDVRHDEKLSDDEWVLTCPESSRTALVRFDGLEPGECTLLPQYRSCGRSCVAAAQKSTRGQHASTC